jgi:hypothetical protein
MSICKMALESDNGFKFVSGLLCLLYICGELWCEYVIILLFNAVKVDNFSFLSYDFLSEWKRTNQIYRNWPANITCFGGCRWNSIFFGESAEIFGRARWVFLHIHVSVCVLEACKMRATKDLSLTIKSYLEDQVLPHLAYLIDLYSTLNY